MAAYVLVQADITDRERFAQYLQKSPAIVARYGGKYIVRGGAMEILEGDGSQGRVVLIEFPSFREAKAWYHSEEYQRLKQLREGAAAGTLILLDGCG